jgi:hypothetical protein
VLGPRTRSSLGLLGARTRSWITFKGSGRVCRRTRNKKDPLRALLLKLPVKLLLTMLSRFVPAIHRLSQQLALRPLPSPLMGTRLRVYDRVKVYGASLAVDVMVSICYDHLALAAALADITATAAAPHSGLTFCSSTCTLTVRPFVPRSIFDDDPEIITKNSTSRGGGWDCRHCWRGLGRYPRQTTHLAWRGRRLKG